LLDLRQTLQQQWKAMLQAKVFAIACRVLADKRDLAHAIGCEPLGFGNHRFKMAGAKFPSKLRDDAKTARVVASFGNLDIGRSLGRSQQAGRVLVIEIVWQAGDGAVPIGPGKTSLR